MGNIFLKLVISSTRERTSTKPALLSLLLCGEIAIGLLHLEAAGHLEYVLPHQHAVSGKIPSPNDPEGENTRFLIAVFLYMAYLLVG